MVKYKIYNTDNKNDHLIEVPVAFVRFYKWSSFGNIIVSTPIH